jgi:tRNA 5-methylaminomethyl-2-thiouridine biosynthesis bifunctional protein
LLDLDDDFALRFLTLWSLWRSDPQRCTRLHVVLVVQRLASPVALRDLILRTTSEHEQVLAEQLIEQWPLNLPGLHRLEFEGLDVTLTIAVGPASLMLERLTLTADAVLVSVAQGGESRSAQSHRPFGLGRLLKPYALLLVHSVTPEYPVWLETSLSFHERTVLPLKTDSLAAKPEESVATFVLRARVSPHVIVDDGMSVQSVSACRHLVVVGGGLAGLHVAQALALRGWRVSVLEAACERGSLQVGHLAAALTPVVSRHDDQYARLSRAGSFRAQARWKQIADEIVTPCGALQLERTSGRIVNLKRIVEELGFSERFIRFVDASQASELAGMTLSRGGLYFPTARRIQPRALLNKLARTDGITCLNATVTRIEGGAGQWRAVDSRGQTLAQAPHMVLATGLSTGRLLAASGLLPNGSRLASMYAVRGELTYVDQALLAGGPRCIVSGDGYVLPALEGRCVLGGNYLNGEESMQGTQSARRDNLVRGAQLLNIPWSRIDGVGWSLDGWGGLRAVVPDRFPVAGPIAQAPGLWVATGFASRGLSWSSLVGDLIAAALTQEPLPLENDIIAKISQI